MVEIEGLTKRYSKQETALEELHLRIGRGVLGLLGPNGAGKTTLMRILAALLPPTSGEARVAGVPLSRPEDIRRVVGYLPQQFQLPPQLTAAGFLDYIAVMKGMSDRRRRRSEIERLLAQLNMLDKADRKLATLSYGMKQRVGIAQALLGDPQVLIVDEPTAGLDPEERLRFRSLLAQFGAAKTVILSTHIIADIETVCSRVAVLNRGRKAMEGTLDELADAAQGRVWQLEMTEREFAAFPQDGVVEAVRSADGIRCRLLSASKPGSYAVPVEPRMEDGYLTLIGGERRG